MPFMGAVLVMGALAVGLGLYARAGHKKRDREWAARKPDQEITDLPPDRYLSVGIPVEEPGADS